MTNTSTSPSPLATKADMGAEGAGVAMGAPMGAPMGTPMGTPIRLTVDFSGGLETLFGGVKSHSLDITVETVKDVIVWLKDNLLKEREDLFFINGTIRPGILVLINDSDWQLEGEEQYVVSSGDSITFISTLHGG